MVSVRLLLAHLALSAVFPTLLVCSTVVGAAEVVPTVSRVVGGSAAAPGEFPSVVAVFAKNFCAGALIAPDVVLTAAHCLDDRPANQIQILAGAVDTGNLSQFNRYSAVDYIVHPFFEPDVDRVSRRASNIKLRSANDIAVIYLLKPAVEPTIKIGQQRKLQNDGTPVVAAGWGVAELTDPRQASQTLQKVTLSIQDLAQCQRSWLSSGYNIGTGVVCATDVGGKADVCEGDSGAPLMAEDNRGNLRVVGLVSLGETGCRDRLPGVYTQVSQYTCWLESLAIPGISSRTGPCKAKRNIPGPVPSRVRRRP